MIYEGANGIQALDLARRKLTIDDGRAMDDFLAGGDDLDRRLADHPPLATMRAALSACHAALAEASRWLRAAWSRDPEAAAAGASDYLRLVGRVACGREMAEAALISLDRDDAFHRAKLATCRFYGARLLAPAAALLGPITAGADDFAALDEG